jgi:outer membrane protein
MKNVSLALNAVLLVAVGVLYYLHFSGSKTGSSSGAAGSLPSKIAFINADSVLKYYEFTKVNRDKLEDKGKRLDQDLNNRAASLRGEIENYQRTRNTLTIGQAQAIEEDLARKQQNFQMYQESASQEMMADNAKMNRDLYDKITQFLKKYGQEQGLQYVLKFDPSSDLLFAGDSLDISKQVVDGLNAAYKQEVEKPTKKDSLANKK